METISQTHPLVAYAGPVALASDLIIAAGCVAVAGAMLFLIRQRADTAQSFRRFARLIAIFLLIVGLSHLASLLPATAGAASKAAIAGMVVVALVLFGRLRPRLAALPSFRDIRDANARLVAEGEAHVRTLRELRDARDELEVRVADRTRALDEARRRYELALRGSEVTLFLQDEDLRYLWISRGGLGLAVDEIIGKTDHELLSDASRTRIIAVKRAALDTGEIQDAEISIETPDGVLWFDLHVEPEKSSDGAVSCIYCSAVDMTARKESEQKLRFFMRELTHRSKNLLAVIQAMARQTAAGADDVKDFLERFGSRLQALSSSHDLLVDESSHGVPFDSLVRSQLGHAADLIGGQITLDGPRVTLSSDATQHIGLALHELATNAIKYGALSTPDGRVTIAWSLPAAENGAGPRFRLSWIEDGGPPVAPPSRRGFGQVVIERTVARTLDGEVELDYAPAGLRWSLDAPMANVARAANT